MNFNKAIIIGRVTKDPETRTTPSGQTVASIGVASNRTWNNNSGEKQEKVEFHSIVAWGKLAEICGQYLVKGQIVLFEGRLETRTWDGQDGVKRSKTEIIAENMQMGPKARGQEGGSSYPAKESSFEQNNANQSSKEDAPNNNPSSDDEIKIEDIPF
ncbi:MAG: single-stranded DNA-binding protein [Candidatus Pacebacteria bacterium]|nr:single-stranded DNA-binding protein [Candidatus Paceibacterota bacterium]